MFLKSRLIFLRYNPCRKDQQTHESKMIKKKTVSILMIALLILAILIFLLLPKEQENAERIGTKVVYGNIAETVLATGKLEAFKKVEVGAQVSGQIEKMYVSIGDTVQNGQILAEIDPRTWHNQLDTAQARLSGDLAQLNSKKAQLTQAKQELARQKALYEVGAVAEKTLQAAQTAYQNANDDLTQIKEQIKQSQINVDTAKLNLGYTKLIAPIDGTVIAAPAEAGQTLNANQNTPNVVTIAQLDKMTVKAEISEADVVRVKPNMPAYFTLLGNQEKKYQATLRRIDPAPQAVSDNGSISANSAIYYYGLFDVPNPDGVLRIGMTANVVISVQEAKQVLVIPLNMLPQPVNQKTQTVNVLQENGDIQARQVTLGINDGVLVEVKEGLKEGEEVVLSASAGGPSAHAERRVKHRMVR